MRMNTRIVLVGLIVFGGLLFVTFFFSGPPQSPDNTITTTPNTPTTQCPTALQQCGAGCIPQNAICCDEEGINSYCLQPTTGCGNGTCYQCPLGQAYCGMFCIEQGKQCCLGGDCSGNGTTNNPTNPTQPNITLSSSPKVVCTFHKTESLWSPDMPWDGSYVCNGTVTFDFHGMAFEDKPVF